MSFNYPAEKQTINGSTGIKSEVSEQSRLVEKAVEKSAISESLL